MKTLRAREYAAAIGIGENIRVTINPDKGEEVEDTLAAAFLGFGCVEADKAENSGSELGGQMESNGGE
jgi:hypothetical protein